MEIESPMEQSKGTLNPWCLGEWPSSGWLLVEIRLDSQIGWNSPYTLGCEFFDIIEQKSCYYHLIINFNF
jgi:hypothetical protein